MKIYILCHIEQYYPSGGLGDCEAIFRDKDSAMIAYRITPAYGNAVMWEVDTETLRWERIDLT